MYLTLFTWIHIILIYHSMIVVWALLKSYHINIVFHLTRAKCAVRMPRERDTVQVIDAKRAMTQLLQLLILPVKKLREKNKILLSIRFYSFGVSFAYGV